MKICIVEPFHAWRECAKYKGQYGITGTCVYYREGQLCDRKPDIKIIETELFTDKDFEI